MFNNEISLIHLPKSFTNDLKRNHKYIEDDKCTNFCTSDPSEIEEKKTIELKISILPYYGLIDTKICTVRKYFYYNKLFKKEF